ncbi:hypothetical protein Dsin_001539 [Dipteronia sinensis]|uniref:Uncharacterized protein n=1 Tax=Dipteronia sinensis TaxID=43782 RepID=A0AAE0EIF3_9ROSI|nr:hypothetical protein Dsin_001539 [Dipteronia sinensis]
MVDWNNKALTDTRFSDLKPPLDLRAGSRSLGSSRLRVLHGSGRNKSQSLCYAASRTPCRIRKNLSSRRDPPPRLPLLLQNLNRWKEHEIDKLVMGYGLLQLPLMSELVIIADDNIYLGINLVRNKERRICKKRWKSSSEPKPQKPNNTPIAETAVMRKKTAKQSRTTHAIEDDDELTRDYCLLKSKLKKGTSR